jgi:uncharacterized protein (TIGR00661 family)
VVVVPPILRHEIVTRKPAIGDRVLVYVRTPSRVERLLHIMEQLDTYTFRVYGCNATKPPVRNIEFGHISADQFLSDLADAKAVITTSGHSLSSESLYFGKPVYAVPTRGDFEQMINAFYVEKLGYGVCDPVPSLARVGDFLS